MIKNTSNGINDTKEIAIKVEGVSKTFHEQKGSGSLKQSFVQLGNKILGKKETDGHKGDFTALKDISFEIKKGEFFGIVGKNGCGKSTLLKILAGVYTPTNGHVAVNGKLTPFIELGVGFNPELSGRDNVFLNGALLGFTRKQMEDMYDEIVEFAELQEHMDKKLKNYSSGMQVRLAFSVAIRAKSDILVIDEVLAVGDEAFQQKCMRIFEEYRETGQTVVLVTHDMGSVRNICTRAMLIEDGVVRQIGSVDEVADLYSDLNTKTEHNVMQKITKSDNANKQIKKKKPIMLVKAKNNKKIYKPTEDLTLDIVLPKPIDNNEYIGVAIHDLHNTYIFGSNTKGQNLTGTRIKHTITLALGPGNYYINTATLAKDGNIVNLDEKIFNFKIINDNNPNASGNVRLKYQYEDI